jgi:predicted amidohydrolase
MSELLKVTLVQTSLFWEEPKKNRDNFDQILQSITQTDVIVLPELFTTGFSFKTQFELMDGPTMAWMQQIAHKYDALVIGSILIESNFKRYNRLICMFPNGLFEFYDKKHLFSLMKEDQFLNPGNSRLIVNYKNWKLCPLICYDLRFPVFSRNNENYDALIYIANWPQSRINHWDKLLPARAIENQCYVIGVNRTGFDNNQIFFNGNSVAIDYKGNELIKLDKEQSYVSIQLNKSQLSQYRQKLPFLKDMDS